MIDKFQRGGDFHSEVAVEMFPHVGQAVQRGEVVVNKTPGRAVPTVKEVFHEERQVAKQCNFAIAYGMGERGLAEATGSTREERSSLSLLGRRRTLPHIRHRQRKYSAQSERAGINHCVQGSAADVVMLAMLRLHRYP